MNRRQFWLKYGGKKARFTVTVGLTDGCTLKEAMAAFDQVLKRNNNENEYHLLDLSAQLISEKWIKKQLAKEPPNPAVEVVELSADQMIERFNSGFEN